MVYALMVGVGVGVLGALFTLVAAFRRRTSRVAYLEELLWDSLRTACSSCSIEGGVHPGGISTWQELCEMFVAKGWMTWDVDVKLFRIIKGETT